MSSIRHELTDAEWFRLETALPQRRRGPERKDDRLVINGILWVLRTGAPWRDLPEQYGPYTTCYNRYNRWSKAGIWCRIMLFLQGNNNSGGEASSQLAIDSSAVRAHKHRSDRAGRRSQSRGTDHQNPCRGRPPRPALYARLASRPRSQTSGKSRSGNHGHCRQGLRHRRYPSAYRRSRGGCGDPFQGQPKEATPAGHGSLCRAQHRGAFFPSRSSGASPRATINSHATFFPQFI